MDDQTVALDVQTVVNNPDLPAGRRASSYRQVVVRHVRDVDASAWNSLRDADYDPFTDLRFIEAVETGMADRAKFWHVVYYDDDGRAAASTSLCLYRVDAALLAEGAVKKVAQAIGRVLPWLTEFRVMFCGLCFSAGQSHVRFAPGVDTRQVLGQLDELLLKLAHEERAKCIVLKEFKPSECQALDAAIDMGYVRADSLPMNHVEPVFHDFDDYLRQQKSSRRYVIRKAQKKFEASAYRVVQMSGGDGADEIFTDEVYRLFEGVFSRAKVRLELVSADTFRELARRLPDSTAFTFIYKGDKVVAFAISIRARAVYHQLFVGYDAALNPECDLYFNLFFHAIDRAYRANVEVIHVGQSADDFKRQKLGCHQRPLYFYIKGVDRATKWVLERFGDRLFPRRFHQMPDALAGKQSHVAVPPALPR